MEDVRELWEQQHGICVYTGIQMQLPISEHESRVRGEKTPTQASLDRIDSSKGYVKGNVEFVCLAVNYAKNGFSKDQMLQFFAQVCRNGVI